MAPALVQLARAEQPDVDVLKKLLNELKKVAEVEAYRPTNLQAWVEAVKGVNAILGQGRINENLLKHADKLEMVQNIGIGYDNIDVSACTKRGVD